MDPFPISINVTGQILSLISSSSICLSSFLPIFDVSRVLCGKKWGSRSIPKRSVGRWPEAR
jgi:hypothetical protein